MGYVVLGLLALVVLLLGIAIVRTLSIKAPKAAVCDTVLTEEECSIAAEKLGAEVYMPPLSLCGDNAAMIGAQAYYEYLAGNTADMSLNAYATKSILGEAL